MRIYEIRVKRALSPSSLPEYQYSLNPYVGCLHGCRYCYAIDFTGGPPAAAWGDIVYVKINLLEVLRKEVGRLKPGVVGLSTLTDPYMPPEARYGLARGSLSILAEAGFKISIQTKSGLVVRDLDLFLRYREAIDVGVTITTLKDKARLLEPLAAHPLARARAVRKLAAAGVKTWIFLGPVVPGFNDGVDDIEEVVRLAHEAGVELIYDRYRPKPRAGEMLRKSLGEVKPTPLWWAKIRRLVEELCGKYGVVCMDMEREWSAGRI
ncbi:MAG: radical SAM protein [Pyrobaculum sp.]